MRHPFDGSDERGRPGSYEPNATLVPEPSGEAVIGHAAIREAIRGYLALNLQMTHEQRVRDAFFIVEPNRTQLVRVASMIDAGELRPIAGAVFPLADARQAYEQKPVHGKVVLTIVA